MENKHLYSDLKASTLDNDPLQKVIKKSPNYC